MENTKLTATQKEAIDLVQDLVKREKIDFNEAFLLIRAIYEKEKEFVYIPYQGPYVEPYRPWTAEPYTTNPYETPYRDDTPWWERNKIWCDLSTNSYECPPGKEIFTYNINNSDILKDWTIDICGH